MMEMLFQKMLNILYTDTIYKRKKSAKQTFFFYMYNVRESKKDEAIPLRTSSSLQPIIVLKKKMSTFL